MFLASLCQTSLFWGMHRSVAFGSNGDGMLAAAIQNPPKKSSILPHLYPYVPNHPLSPAHLPATPAPQVTKIYYIMSSIFSQL